MFFGRKFTLGLLQRSVRNFCPEIVRNEGKRVRKLNFGNILQLMYIIVVFLYNDTGRILKSCELIK